MLPLGEAGLKVHKTFFFLQIYNYFNKKVFFNHLKSFWNMPVPVPQNRTFELELESQYMYVYKYMYIYVYTYIYVYI